MQVVLNKRLHVAPPGAVYIGRPSKWGNPFVIGKDGTRAQVIRRYERHLYESGLIFDIDELRGRALVCWCKPSACHGDVLVKVLQWRMVNAHRRAQGVRDSRDPHL